MSADTLSAGALKVLTKARIPNDSTTTSTQAITDIKAYMNQRAKNIWARRIFREYLILGTYEVPASTKLITLASITPETGWNTSGQGRTGTFAEVAAIREGSNPLLPEDIGAVNAVDAGAWSSSSSPIYFINRGQSGILLLGQYTAATTLSFWGKASFQDLTDNETWILGDSDALIEGATADMYTYWWSDPTEAAKQEAKFENAVRLLVDAQEVQAAQKRRIIPTMPIGMSSTVDYATKTGIRR